VKWTPSPGLLDGAVWGAGPRWGYPPDDEDREWAGGGGDGSGPRRAGSEGCAAPGMKRTMTW